MNAFGHANKETKMGLYTAGKSYIPYECRGVVTGTYSDTTTRIIDVVVEKVAGTLNLPPFPNQPTCLGSFQASSGFVGIGIVTSKVDPDNSNQMIITVDRGYIYELWGASQPETYNAPLAGGMLCFGSPGAAGMEANAWAAAVHPILAAMSSTGTGAGIFKDIEDAFVVAATDPASLTVTVGKGKAATADGIISFDTAQDVVLAPVFVKTDEDGYYMKARIYLNKLNGEIGVVYGAAHASNAVAPNWPSNSIYLATIALTQGDTSVVTGDITDARVGLT